ncbi:MAG: ankyrin repeat domain-containing protein, partial [Parachlamydiaceae bacterium]
MNTEKYIHITINNSHFNVIENERKNENGALDTLKKIEEIVRERLSYAGEDSKYAQLDNDSLYELLKSKSQTIIERFHAKQEKLNCLAQVFFQSKKLFAIHRNIENYVNPPAALPVPNDLIPQILEELSLQELVRFSSTNRTAHHQADIALLHIAKKCGYGGLEVHDAISYLKELAKELEIAPIPREFLVLRKGNKEVDGLKTLDNLRREKDFSNLLYSLFDQEGASDLSNFKKVMALLKKWPVTGLNQPKVAISALLKCCETGDLDVLNLLLKHGVDPNGTLSNSGTALSRAIDYNHIDMAKTLLKSGAKVDFSSLAFASGGYHRTPSLDQLKVLLDHTPDVNIRNFEGSTPLFFAVKSGKSEIISLLLSKGANP